MPATDLALWLLAIPYASSLFIRSPTLHEILYLQTWFNKWAAKWSRTVCEQFQWRATVQVSPFRTLTKSFVTSGSKHIYTIWVHIMLQNAHLTVVLYFALSKFKALCMSMQVHGHGSWPWATSHHLSLPSSSCVAVPSSHADTSSRPDTVFTAARTCECHSIQIMNNREIILCTFHIQWISMKFGIVVHSNSCHI
jgi:hypothetical protein